MAVGALGTPTIPEFMRFLGFAQRQVVSAEGRSTGNDSATGEALGVCGEHSCGHRAAGGQANDVDARERSTE